MIFFVFDFIVIFDIYFDVLFIECKVKLLDIDVIYEFIGYWVVWGLMLVCFKILFVEIICDFYFVLVELYGGYFSGLVGVCGLYLFVFDFVEVCGFVIYFVMQGCGLGKQFVFVCEVEVWVIDFFVLFVWIYQQGFFEKCGFYCIEKMSLYFWVWFECQCCVFFENCNEIVMLWELM